MTALVEIRDADFPWLLGGATTRPGLNLPPGGVDTPETLAIVRAIHAALGGDGQPGSWMMVQDGEVVGLCGYVRPSGDGATVEIGYGVAAARRRLGHAGRAVAAMVAMARNDGGLRAVTAVTAEHNLPSQGVLILNGFVETGREHRDEDGPVILWRLNLD